MYNCIGQKVYAFDPDKKNRNVNVLFGMIKGNHIYTMNDNIKSIAQTELEENMKLCASTDFRLNSKEKPAVKYDFFNGIDDIMGIVEENEDEKEVNLVSGQEFEYSFFVSSRGQSNEPKIIMGAGWQCSITQGKI